MFNILLEDFRKQNIEALNSILQSILHIEFNRKE